MTPQEATPEAVAAILADRTYGRERADPHPSDVTYLHLSDVLAYLQRFATAEPLRVLDFGCGGSPYRSLFPQARYARADFPNTQGLDYAIGADSKIDAAASSFDLILSTQVLEHVAAPADYLQECYRLLAPGGRLVLTTHGFYEEHGCPHDFHRWTADGLRLEMERTQFRVLSAHKLTCGGRALLQLLSHHHGGLYGPRWHPFGVSSAGLRFLFRRYRGFIHRCSDRFQREYAVVPAADNGHPFFLGLGIEAAKPR
jgi:SAM-dependent methyltransferase